MEGREGEGGRLKREGEEMKRRGKGKGHMSSQGAIHHQSSPTLDGLAAVYQQQTLDEPHGETSHRFPTQYCYR